MASILVIADTDITHTNLLPDMLFSQLSDIPTHSAVISPVIDRHLPVLLQHFFFHVSLIGRMFMISAPQMECAITVCSKCIQDSP
jgi:hypothetical protein